MRLAIYNIQIIDPYSGSDKIGNLYIEGDKFVQSLTGSPDREIQGQGLVAAPSFIDLHTHLRDPGFTDAEDITSGTRAAARGGYGLLCAMPNTKPVCDTPEGVNYVIDKARKAGYTEVLPIPAASRGLRGETLTDFAALKAAGAVGVTDDGMPFKDSRLTYQILREAARQELLPIDHPEMKSLSRGAVMNAGEAARKLGYQGMPNTAESICVARDLLIAADLDLPIHLCHLSTAESVDLVRLAKARGVPVTADTCPHYFTLTDTAVVEQKALAKMYPPLRQEKDRRAIIEGLRDGTIDAIATDHAPHVDKDKGEDLTRAKNGIIGLETAFSLAFTILCQQEGFGLDQVLALFTRRPAQVIKRNECGLLPGEKANLVIFDPRKTYRVKAEELLSKSHNTPFIGWPLQAKILYTLWKGNFSYDQSVPE